MWFLKHSLVIPLFPTVRAHMDLCELLLHICIEKLSVGRNSLLSCLFFLNFPDLIQSQVKSFVYQCVAVTDHTLVLCRALSWCINFQFKPGELYFYVGAGPRGSNSYSWGVKTAEVQRHYKVNNCCQIDKVECKAQYIPLKCWRVTVGGKKVM